MRGIEHNWCPLHENCELREAVVTVTRSSVQWKWTNSGLPANAAPTPHPPPERDQCPEAQVLSCAAWPFSSLSPSVRYHHHHHHLRRLHYCCGSSSSPHTQGHHCFTRGKVEKINMVLPWTEQPLMKSWFSNPHVCKRKTDCVSHKIP